MGGRNVVNRRRIFVVVAAWPSVSSSSARRVRFGGDVLAKIQQIGKISKFQLKLLKSNKIQSYFSRSPREIVDSDDGLVVVVMVRLANFRRVIMAIGQHLQ